MDTLFWLKLWLGGGVLVYFGFWFYIHWEHTLNQVWQKTQENIIMNPHALFNYVFSVALCVVCGPLSLGLIWVKLKKDREQLDRDL